MNLIYWQFSNWKKRVVENIKGFNKGNNKEKDFEEYLRQNENDFTFEVKIESIQDNINLDFYVPKIAEIQQLISQIGDFEFSFFKK